MLAASTWTFVALATMMLAGCSSAPSPQSDATPAPAPSQPSAAATGSDMIALALSAAPADIAAQATVMEPGEAGQMKELRAGTNGWVCMAHPEVMCLDKQWQEWADAWMNKRPPTITSVGVGYMLQGDRVGGSNTDPFATEPTADNQWVVSPPHVMVLTPDPRQLESLPTDPKNGGPWVMWKGTPYAHIMVPTEPMANATPPAAQWQPYQPTQPAASTCRLVTLSRGSSPG